MTELIKAGSGKIKKKRKLNGFYDRKGFRSFEYYWTWDKWEAGNTHMPFNSLDNHIARLKIRLGLKSKNEKIDFLSYHKNFSDPKCGFVDLYHLISPWLVESKVVIDEKNNLISYAVRGGFDSSKIDIVTMNNPSANITPNELAKAIEAFPSKEGINPELLTLNFYLKKNRHDRTCLVVPMSNKHPDVIEQLSHHYGHILIKTYTESVPDCDAFLTTRYYGVYRNMHKLWMGLSNAICDCNKEIIK